MYIQTVPPDVSPALTFQFACTVSCPAGLNLTRQACRQGDFGSPDWWRGGLAFNEMNGWRNQNLNRLYCFLASKGVAAWQWLWSCGTNTKRGEQVCCPWPSWKDRQRTGVRRYSASIWMCSLGAHATLFSRRFCNVAGPAPSLWWVTESRTAHSTEPDSPRPRFCLFECLDSQEKNIPCDFGACNLWKGITNNISYYSSNQYEGATFTTVCFVQNTDKWPCLCIQKPGN